MDVRSILGSSFLDTFGFTEDEVAKLCADLGRPEILDEIRRWYNGYLFSGQVIYNPWSVLNFASHPEAGLCPYWVNTASEDALRGVVLETRHVVAHDFEVLLAGDSIRKTVSEHVVMRDVNQDPTALWSLLLLSGYLTARRVERVEGDLVAELVLPNMEMRTVFRHSVRTWVAAGFSRSSGDVESLSTAMLAGDASLFNRLLQDLVLQTLSFHDTGGRNPERVYQAFLLGMLVHLGSTHQLRSNRESGFGRYDVMVLPREPGRPGVVIELKEIDEWNGEDAQRALDEALRQVHERDYVAELRGRGADPIVTYGVVFDGKRVWVRKG